MKNHSVANSKKPEVKKVKKLKELERKKSLLCEDKAELLPLVVK
jgi:hypothetical protein